MNAPPNPRPRIETSTPTRPSPRRSTVADFVLPNEETARERAPLIAPPTSARRMKSRRLLPGFTHKDSRRASSVSIDVVIAKRPENRPRVTDVRVLLSPGQGICRKRSHYLADSPSPHKNRQLACSRNVPAN